MSQQYRQDEAEYSFQDVWAQVKQFTGSRRVGMIMIAIGAAIVVLWLASGIFVVGAGERGVVLTFGKVSEVTEPGLRYHIPWPVQSRHVVDIATVRRGEIGFESTARGSRPLVSEASMLTGDENIVHVEVFVQYVVKDPIAFVFRVRDPEIALREAAQVALRSEVGQHPIEFTMTEGRVTVQDAVRQRLQKLLDSYESGLQISDLRLLTVDPPSEVRDAFLEVVRAFEDRERLVQEARAYSARVVPEARGEAAKMLQEAEGYRERRTLRAQGDAERFLLTLKEYLNAPEVTRDRLYLEMVEESLKDTDKFILSDRGTEITPFLPLRPLITAPNSIPVPESPSAAERKQQ